MKVKKAVLLLSVLFSFAASAGTICPSKAVTGVLLKKSGDVFYTVQGDDGSPVQRGAGNISTPVGAKNLEMLMALVNSTVLIQANYPVGFNCEKSSDQNVAPEWLFAENQAQR